MPNTALVRKQNLSSFRTIALGTWRTAKDPSVYGALALRVDPVLAWIERKREETGQRITLSHVMARAVALAIADMPDANGIVRLGHIYLRQQVDVFFQVVMKDPETGEVDLSGLTIREADKKDVPTITGEFTKLAEKVRAGKDAEKEATRSLFKKMPGWLAGWALDLTGFLLYTLNLDLRWLGLPKDPFGSVMVTNIGSLGLEEAYVPLVPYSRVPLLLAMGAVKKVPAVDEETDAIVVERQMRVFATFDHRMLDGAHAARMASRLAEIFADPDAHL